MNAPLFEPQGMPVPTRENGPKVSDPSEDEKGYRVARTEEFVFDAQPEATHFRYPWVYGPRQPAPREWSIVRRVLDRRPHIIVPDAGLSLSHFGYVENLAHAVLLAVDQPQIAKGEVYNCGDQEVLSLRQVVDTIARSMDHAWNVVSMPWELAIPARPLVSQPWTNHRIVSTAKIEAELGYRDIVQPVDGLARTARWLSENRPEPYGIEEIVLQDPFDYAAEDLLIERYKEALSTVSMPDWEEGKEPGYGLAYSGPGGRAQSQPDFS
jgi:nucleoside-diphosphate-sugar epimerase